MGKKAEKEYEERRKLASEVDEKLSQLLNLVKDIRNTNDSHADSPIDRYEAFIDAFKVPTGQNCGVAINFDEGEHEVYLWHRMKDGRICFSGLDSEELDELIQSSPLVQKHIPAS